MLTSAFFRILFSTLLTIVPYFLSAQNYCYPFGKQHTPQIIKTNVLALPFNSINLEYERLWTSKVSIGLSSTFTPKSGLPFKGMLDDYFDSDEDRENLDKIKYRHFSVKPNMRFYFGEQPDFTRFYTTAYLKYSRYSPSFSSDYFVTNSATGEVQPLEVSYGGGINTLAIGYGIGLQFNLHDRLYLDWQIIGTHVGYGFGTVTGRPSNGYIPPSAQDNIRNTLDKLEDFPIYQFSGEVNDTQAQVQSNGPIIGVTMGLSLGYRFR